MLFADIWNWQQSLSLPKHRGYEDRRLAQWNMKRSLIQDLCSEEGFLFSPEIRMKAIIFLCRDGAGTCKIGAEKPTCFLLNGFAAWFSFESSIRISDVTLKGRNPGCVRCFVFDSQRI
jgi:hypothetical protein